MASAAPRVLFMHGLESNAHGTKARYLAARFEAHTAAMDTGSLEAALESQRAALAAFRPDLVVGSSFGGALAVRLLTEGAWRGPTVLLAPAAARLGVANALPEGVVVTVVHALRDELIPAEHSRALAATGTPGLVTLVEVDDHHRLASLTEGDGLAKLVRATWARHAAGPAAA